MARSSKLPPDIWQLLLLLGVVAVASIWFGARSCHPSNVRAPGLPLERGAPIAATAGSVRDQALGDAYPAHEVRPTAKRRYELTAAPASIQLGARSDPLQVWAYNGSVPGPTLRVRAGEQLTVRFQNRLPQPTTIHWHGVRVPNAMDGVPGVTQPPIDPGGSFVYRFVPRDAGTFWYHPHVRGSQQVERGLQGVLVVDDEHPPPWSKDVVWVLDDWRLTDSGQIDPRFNTPHDLMHDGRWGNLITVNGDPNYELAVRPGERVRLRLVDTANGRVFKLDFGELAARAIAVDGMYAEHPFDPNGFELAPGNRIDLDLTIPVAARGRKLSLTNTFARRPFPLAVLRVTDEPPVPTPEFETLARARLPDWSKGLELDPLLTYRLGARRGGQYGIAWTLNDEVYGEDQRASLPQGEWVKVRYQNESARLHPMHMHGVFFRVLSRNGAPALEPYFRDTVLVHPRETVDIALVPVDTGKWALHCHVLEHAEAGMMTVFEVARAEAGGEGNKGSERAP